MSAPIIWIFFPLVAAGALFLLRRYYRVSVALGTVLALFLAVLALILPLDQEIQVGNRAFSISSVQFLFGRQFVISNGERALLSLVYIIPAFWFLPVFASRAGRMLVPLGLAIVALLTAALAVEPFLYAGLLIGLAVLASIPILAPPGFPIERGVLRYLTFSTLGLPLILFTGWMLAGVEARPGDAAMVSRASAMLGLGFMLLMGVFPFHTWVLMLSEKGHPYAVSFVLFILPWMVTLFGLGFLDQYAWMNNPQFYALLRLVGALMVAALGFWCAFERHLGRLMGYNILIQTGFSIVVIGLSSGLSVFFATIVPRVVSLAICGLSLSVIKSRAPGLAFRDVAGLGRSLPLTASALVMAQLSIAGLPVMAGYPVNFSVWISLARLDTLAFFGILLGSVGIIVAALRTLTVLVTGPGDAPWSVKEDGFTGTLIGLAILAMLVVGIFPQFFLPPLLNTVTSFPQLIP